MTPILAEFLDEIWKDVSFLALVISQVVTAAVVTVMWWKGRHVMEQAGEILDVAKHYQRLSVSETNQAKRIADAVVRTADVTAQAAAQAAAKKVTETPTSGAGKGGGP